MMRHARTFLIVAACAAVVVALPAPGRAGPGQADTSITLALPPRDADQLVAEAIEEAPASQAATLADGLASDVEYERAAEASAQCAAAAAKADLGSEVEVSSNDAVWSADGFRASATFEVRLSDDLMEGKSQEEIADVLGELAVDPQDSLRCQEQFVDSIQEVFQVQRRAEPGFLEGSLDQLVDCLVATGMPPSTFDGAGPAEALAAAMGEVAVRPGVRDCIVRFPSLLAGFES